MIYLTDGKRHLICHPYSIENLHAMAEKLNIKRCWFHKNHYDIPMRRCEEIEERCIKISTRELIKIMRNEESRLSRETVLLKDTVSGEQEGAGNGDLDNG